MEKAKKLGYAESNPATDLNGEDVSSKLQILSALCFNSFISNEINVEGIKNIEKHDIINSNTLGFKIKLLGFAEIINNKLYQRVHPTLVKKNSYIGSVEGVLNAVIIDGIPVGKNIIQGEGAGAAPTTSALISDISSILRGNIKYPFTISNKERKSISSGKIYDLNFSSYIRLEVKDTHGVLSDITKIFAKNKVSIKRLIQNPNKFKKSASVVIITHKSKDILLKKTLSKITKKKYIIRTPVLIRIENN